MTLGSNPPRSNFPPDSEPWRRWNEGQIRELTARVERALGKTTTLSRQGVTTAAAGQSVTAEADRNTRIAGARAQTDPSNLLDMVPVILRDPSLFWAARQVEMSDTQRRLDPIEPNITAWLPDGFTITSTEVGETVYLGNLDEFVYAGDVKGVPKMSVVSTRPAPWGTGDWTQGAWDGTSFAVTGLLYSADGEWLGIPMDHGARAFEPLPFVDLWNTGAYDVYIGGANGAANLTAWGGFPHGRPLQPGETFPETATWRPAMIFRFSQAGESITVRGLNLTIASGAVNWSSGVKVPGSAIQNDAIEIQQLSPELRDLLAGKAPLSHTHTQSEVDGLAAALAGKSDVGHGHSMQQVAGLEAALADKAPLSHSHTGTEVAQATETARGAIEIATVAETRAGTDSSRAVTPAGLAAFVNVGSFRNINDNPDAGLGFLNIPSGGWHPLPLPPMTGYSRHNTLNGGQAATISNDYLVAPRTGRYLVSVGARFAPSGAGTARGICVRVTPTGARQMESSQRATSAGIPPYPLPMSTVAEVLANEGDVIQPLVTQNSGAALGVSLETFVVSYLGQ